MWEPEAGNRFWRPGPGGEIPLGYSTHDISNMLLRYYGEVTYINRTKVMENRGKNSSAEILGLDRSTLRARMRKLPEAVSQYERRCCSTLRARMRKLGIQKP